MSQEMWVKQMFTFGDKITKDTADQSAMTSLEENSI